MLSFRRPFQIVCILVILMNGILPASFGAPAPVMAQEILPIKQPPIAPRSMQGIADHGFDSANPMAFVRSQDSRTFSHVVTDREGALHAIFYNQATGNLMYLASPEIEQGQTGAATVIASIPPIGQGKYPRIAVDDGGAVHVIWIENIHEGNGDRDHMRYAWCETNCTDSRSWQKQAESLPLDVPLFCELIHPALVAWGSGSQRRIAVAVQQTGSTADIKVTQFADGVWHPYFDVAEGTSASFLLTPAIDVDRTNGILHVIWLKEITGSDPVLQYRQWIDGRDGQGNWSYAQGAWSPPVELYTGVVGNLWMQDSWATHFVNSYGITVDAAGQVHVAFPVQNDYFDPQEPWHMSCVNGCDNISQWTTPGNIVEQASICDEPSAATTMNHTIRLTPAPDGRVYALWKRLNNPDEAQATEVEIYTATYQNGQWSSVERVGTYPFTLNNNHDAPFDDVANIDLVIREHGNPAAAWMRFRDTAQPFITEYIPSIYDNEPYIMRIKQNTSLPSDLNGCQTLTVHPNTGWYEQPLISYTIELESYVDEDIDLELDIVLDSHTTTRTRLVAPDTQIEENIEYGLMKLTLPSQTTITKVITVLAQPSSESTFEGYVNSFIRVQQNVIYSQSAHMHPIQVPKAAVRPVVIVPGFLGSYYRDGELVLDPLLGAYNGLIENLEFYGYEESNSLIKFPYQWWDKELVDVATDLDVVLSNWWVNHTAPDYIRTDQFDVIAHSEGGLVVRAYEDLKTQNNQPFQLHSILMAGTPHQGTPVAYAGYEGLDTLLSGFEDFFTRFTLFRGLAGKAGCHAGGSLRPFDVSDAHLYDYIHGNPCPFGAPVGIPLLEIALPPHNATGDPAKGIPAQYLFDVGGPGGGRFGGPNPILRALNARADGFLQNVAANQGVVVSLYSDDIDTITRYNVVPTPLRYQPLWAHGMPDGWTPAVYGDPVERKQKYISEGNGDDTVPGWSANLSTIPAAKGFLVHSPNIHIDKVEKTVHHVTYFKDLRGLYISMGMLLNPNLIDGQGEYPSYLPLSYLFDINLPWSWDGALDAKRLIVNYCPVDILLTDSFGRRIGTLPSGEVVNEIPGASYSGAGANDTTPVMFQVPPELHFTMQIVGRDAEPYTILDYYQQGDDQRRMQMWTGTLQAGEQHTESLVAIDPKLPPRALVVGDNQESSYVFDLRSIGHDVTAWNILEQGLPTIEDLFPYDLVIWTSTQTDTYPDALSSTIETYIQAGAGFLVAAPQTLLRFDQATQANMFYIADLQPTQSRRVDGEDLFYRFQGLGVSDAGYTLMPLLGATSIFAYDTGAGSATLAIDHHGRLIINGIDITTVEDTALRQRLLWAMSAWLRNKNTSVALPYVHR